MRCGDATGPRLQEPDQGRKRAAPARRGVGLVGQS